MNKRNQKKKKLKKGKTPEIIAGEREEEYTVIAGICEKAEALAPEYDYERLYTMLYGEDNRQESIK